MIGAQYIRKLQHGDLIYKTDLNNALLSSILSFCENQAMREQNAPIEASSEYAYHSRLHAFTSVKKLSGASFVRVGRNHDGGYVMVFPYSREKIAYSIGIANDVSWDKQMADAGYEIYMYDHTIERLPEKNKRFHWKKVGIGLSGGTDRLIGLKDMLAANNHLDVKGMVLKMDVEGAEWDAIDACDMACLKSFDQIVMELHGLLGYGKRNTVLRVLEKLQQSHEVFHVHGNNLTRRQFIGDLVTPDCLEISYIKREIYQTAPSDMVFPMEMDQPCNMKLNEIMLGRWNVDISRAELHGRGHEIG